MYRGENRPSGEGCAYAWRIIVGWGRTCSQAFYTLFADDDRKAGRRMARCGFFRASETDAKVDSGSLAILVVIHVIYWD